MTHKNNTYKNIIPSLLFGLPMLLSSCHSLASRNGMYEENASNHPNGIASNQVNNGKTELMIALETCAFRQASFLIKDGVNIDAQDNNGNMAIDYLKKDSQDHAKKGYNNADSGYYEILDALIRKKNFEMECSLNAEGQAKFIGSIKDGEFRKMYPNNMLLLSVEKGMPIISTKEKEEEKEKWHYLSRVEDEEGGPHYIVSAFSIFTLAREVRT